MSSLLLTHHHIWRGCFPPLRWQISFQHYPHVSRGCLLLTLRATAAPSVGVTAKPLGWVWLARHRCPPLCSSSLSPCLHAPAARLWLLGCFQPSSSLLGTLSPAFPLLASQHAQLNLHHPQSLGLGVVFISLSLHNLSELFTLLPALSPAPFPRSCRRPHPQGLTRHGGAALNPPRVQLPLPGVSQGPHEPRVCGSLTLLKGTYRPISCYTIALDSQAMGPRAFAQINRVWN